MNAEWTGLVLTVVAWVLAVPLSRIIIRLAFYEPPAKIR